MTDGLHVECNYDNYEIYQTQLLQEIKINLRGKMKFDKMIHSKLHYDAVEKSFFINSYDKRRKRLLTEISESIKIF